MPDGHANQIAINGSDNPIALSGNLDFNSKIHRFQKRLGYLDGINAKFYNIQARKDV